MCLNFKLLFIFLIAYIFNKRLVRRSFLIILNSFSLDDKMSMRKISFLKLNNSNKIYNFTQVFENSPNSHLQIVL